MTGRRAVVLLREMVDTARRAVEYAEGWSA